MKKAQESMGTLIIFIAMILCAAVAASVLISTTSRLQNKALTTGKMTTSEVGTGLMAIELFAENGDDQQLESFYMTIKLSQGSDPMKFGDLLLINSLSDTVDEFVYNSSINCDDASTFTSETGYGVIYALNGTNHREGYLNRGDIGKLCFAPSRAIIEGDSIKLQLIPKTGSIMLIETTAPDLIDAYRIKIFP